MLTDTAARKAKPYTLTDAAALYLEVMPTGATYWRSKRAVPAIPRTAHASGAANGRKAGRSLAGLGG